MRSLHLLEAVLNRICRRTCRLRVTVLVPLLVSAFVPACVPDILSADSGDLAAAGSGESAAGVLVEYLVRNHHASDKVAEEGMPNEDDFYPHAGAATELWSIRALVHSDSHPERLLQFRTLRVAVSSRNPAQVDTDHQSDNRGDVDAGATTANQMSAWRFNHLFLNSVTLTDPESDRFIATQSIARGALGLSGIEPVSPDSWTGKENRYRVVTGNRLLELVRADPCQLDIDITAEIDAQPVRLSTSVLGCPIRPFGETSIPDTGTGIGAIGQSVRLGRVVDGVVEGVPVTAGVVWVDRVWGSSSISQAAPVVIDQFRLPVSFAGRTEDAPLRYAWLVLQVIRRASGKGVPVIDASLVYKATEEQPTGAQSFGYIVEPLDYRGIHLTTKSSWQSQHSGQRYGASWILVLDALDLELSVNSSVDDQELSMSGISQWSGMVSVQARSLSGASTVSTSLKFGIADLSPLPSDRHSQRQ